MGIYFSWNCFLQSPWTQLVWIRIDHTELVWCREVKDFSISYAMNILCHCFKNVIFKDELKVMLRAKKSMLYSTILFVLYHIIYNEIILKNWIMFMKTQFPFNPNSLFYKIWRHSLLHGGYSIHKILLQLTPIHNIL